MQVCTLLQTDNYASTPPLSFFTGQMPFLPPNQQRQSTVGKRQEMTVIKVNIQIELRHKHFISRPGCSEAAATGGLMFCLCFCLSIFLTIRVRPIISTTTRPIFAKFSGLVELWL